MTRVGSRASCACGCSDFVNGARSPERGCTQALSVRQSCKNLQSSELCRFSRRFAARSLCRCSHRVGRLSGSGAWTGNGQPGCPQLCSGRSVVSRGKPALPTLLPAAWASPLSEPRGPRGFARPPSSDPRVDTWPCRDPSRVSASGCPCPHLSVKAFSQESHRQVTLWGRFPERSAPPNKRDFTFCAFAGERNA